jgi:2-iminobutanoate/2-iminopropanoate deaminase
MTAASHEPVIADGLPAPVGPYSPGMTLDRLVIVSGQGATDPATGALVGADVAAQTEQVFRNIAAMNAVYARVFGDHRPARTTVQVAALPEPGLRVEIDAIAYRP